VITAAMDGGTWHRCPTPRRVVVVGRQSAIVLYEKQQVGGPCRVTHPP
jgi:hypothetical protein